METHITDAHFAQPVYIEQARRGVIVFSGKDRIDFLQRQTTNDVRGVASERILTTVLTSPTGRILDVLQLTEDEGQDGALLYAISLPGRAPAVTAYFKSRIFFMDQVKVVDASSDYTHFDLAGQGVQEVLGQMGFLTLPEGDYLASAIINGSKLKAFQQNHHLGIGFQLIAPIEQRERIRSMLEELGALPLTPQEYEVMRVEAGIPVVDQELTEEHTPLEVNLQDAISDNKGCFTGQEVIARQMNYDKVTRKLVGLVLQMDAAAGSQLQSEGKTVGKMTSFVRSPRFGPIALAMVKRPYHTDGTELTVKDGDLETSARVIAIPFRI